jgi:hypothetical protein
MKPPKKKAPKKGKKPAPMSPEMAKIGSRMLGKC